LTRVKGTLAFDKCQDVGMSTTDLSAETRSRILSAAWARVRDQGVAAVTVKDVASDAGVSRQLVYFHYRNRAGLLTAMARNHDRTSGFADRLGAAWERPPAEAFEAVVREWLGYLPELLPVARALEAAAITGDAGGEAWRDRMDSLRAVFREAVERLGNTGLLRPDWTVDEAAEWTWSQVHPGTYAHLVAECGWPAARFADRAVETLVSGLMAAEATPRGR
jgi:AcrR family transcriptional regulator